MRRRQAKVHINRDSSRAPRQNADFPDELSFDEQAAGRASEIAVDIAAADFVNRFEVFSVFWVSHVSFPQRFLLRTQRCVDERKHAIVHFFNKTCLETGDSGHELLKLWT